jgi:putative transposase
VTGTSGSEGGPRKRTSRKAGAAPRSDPYTKLLGPEKWTYFHLYVVIDIFSRYVTGWLLATRETAELAERLLGETIRKQHVEADQLTIHADRGTSMASKTVALLLADLGVAKSHSRPHCSNDCDDLPALSGVV